MIFTGFKRKSNQIFFNKRLPDLLERVDITSSEKIKSAIVLLDDISKKDTIQNALCDLLGIPVSAIKVLIIQKKITKGYPAVEIFSPKDFGWYGKIISDTLKVILTKKYDLLINYSKVENIYSNLLVLQCNAAFRVGFAHFDKRLYDLIIKCEPSDIASFNIEIKKYLAILNKI